MHALRVFGGFALSDPADERGRRLPQRRAEALLAVLAVAGDLGASRDRLVGLFWPENTQALARHALRDALWVIRQVVGPDAILATGDTLVLNPDVVSSDVQHFAQAVAAHAWSEAVVTYRGPLLAGFHVDEAPEFERWLDAERARLFRQCKWALESLAAEAERAVKWRDAARWWGRALELDPYDTRLVVRRVVALAHSGDRANALKEGEEHRHRLEVEMELQPDPAFLEELARVRRGEIGASWYSTPGDRLAMPPSEPRQAVGHGGGRHKRRHSS
jgi:DNA-binding SARP family transcriptional activator